MAGEEGDFPLLKFSTSQEWDAPSEAEKVREKKALMAEGSGRRILYERERERERAVRPQQCVSVIEIEIEIGIGISSFKRDPSTTATGALTIDLPWALKWSTGLCFLLPLSLLSHKSQASVMKKASIDELKGIGWV